MTIPHGIGTPTVDGLYCVEIYFGWKLLEWRDGRWWFEGNGSLWAAGDPLQWVGPMPETMNDAVSSKTKLDYDL